MRLKRSLRTARKRRRKRINHPHPSNLRLRKKCAKAR
jgi:hypothetical protein